MRLLASFTDESYMKPGYAVSHGCRAPTFFCLWPKTRRQRQSDTQTRTSVFVSLRGRLLCPNTHTHTGLTGVIAGLGWMDEDDGSAWRHRWHTQVRMRMERTMKMRPAFQTEGLWIRQEAAVRWIKQTHPICGISMLWYFYAVVFLPSHRPRSSRSARDHRGWSPTGTWAERLY